MQIFLNHRRWILIPEPNEIALLIKALDTFINSPQHKNDNTIANKLITSLRTLSEK